MNSLTRISDTSFLFKHKTTCEIILPKELPPTERFHLATVVSDILCKNTIDNFHTFKLLNKKWSLTLKTESRIFSCFMKTTYPKKAIIEVEPYETPWYSYCFKKKDIIANDDIKDTAFTPISLNQKNDKDLSFNDPFTQLATLCFQRYESWTNSSRTSDPYYFALSKDNKLTLQKNDSNKLPQVDTTVRKLYIEILHREYGAKIAESADQILEIDTPLCPKDILLLNLKALLLFQNQEYLDTFKAHIIKFNQSKDESIFTQRERRCIYRAVQKTCSVNEMPSKEQVKTYLGNLATEKIPNILHPTHDELRRASTGKVIHT